MKCPRCNGRMSYDRRDKDYVCLNCGHIIPSAPLEITPPPAKAEK